MAEIKIYGELKNETLGGYVTEAGQVQDLIQSKSQAEINESSSVFQNRFQVMTEEQYEALGDLVDPDTFYFTTEDSD